MQWNSARDSLRRIRNHSPFVHTPYLLSAALFLVCVLGVVLLFANRNIAVSIAHTYKNTALVIATTLVELTNQDRAKSNLHTLSVNPLLVAAAQAKADDMATRGYFAHFDTEGKAPWDWIREAGYAYRYAGENLAVQFSDSSDVEEAWLASPTHRANLLDTRFTEVGIAVAAGSYEGRPTVFVVQMFGTPKDVFVAPYEEQGRKPVDEDGLLSSATASNTLGVAESKVEEADITEAPKIETQAQEPEVFVLGLAQTAHQAADEPLVTGQKEADEMGAVPVAPLETEPVLVTANSEQHTQASNPLISHLLASPWFAIKAGLLGLISVLMVFMLYLSVQEWAQGHKKHTTYAASLSVAYMALFVLLGSASVGDVVTTGSETVAFAADQTQLVFAQVDTAYKKDELLALNEMKRQRAETQTAAVSVSLSNPPFQRTFLVLFILMFLYGGFKLALERYYHRGKSL